MVTIQGSYAGINTVRNISLIHRSLSRTKRRVDSPDSAQFAEKSAADLALSRRMRTQMGVVTEQIRELETGIQRNQAAANSLEQLVHTVRELKSAVADAAADPDANLEDSRAYQTRVTELVNGYNQQLAAAEFDGEKLFSTGAAKLFQIRKMPDLETDSPEDIANAMLEIDSTLRELGEHQLAVGNRSRSDYEATVKKLEVASQNLAAADAGVRDESSAEEISEEATALIQRNAELAGNAQRFLTSDSVFQLLHA